MNEDLRLFGKDVDMVNLNIMLFVFMHAFIHSLSFFSFFFLDNVIAKIMTDFFFLPFRPL